MAIMQICNVFHSVFRQRLDDCGACVCAAMRTSGKQIVADIDLYIYLRRSMKCMRRLAKVGSIDAWNNPKFMTIKLISYQLWKGQRQRTDEEH